MMPPTRSTDTEYNGTASQEQYVIYRQESDMQSDSTSCEGYCSLMRCIDLSYVATEPFRSVEQRTIDAHRQLWGFTSMANAAENTRKYTVVHPRLRYTPRLPRTGSMVMLNWCTLDSVATSATVETSVSQTEASLHLADHDEHSDEEEEEEELEFHMREENNTERSISPCQWGYFVDSSSPPPNAAQAAADDLPSPTRVRFTRSYRRFMSREIAASARYDGFDHTHPIDGPSENKFLRRVAAQPNLQMKLYPKI
jgi:hypothetical protein